MPWPVAIAQGGEEQYQQLAPWRCEMSRIAELWGKWNMPWKDAETIWEYAVQSLSRPYWGLHTSWSFCEIGSMPGPLTTTFCCITLCFDSFTVAEMGLSENRVYSQWNSHLIGIMISKTIGFFGVHNIFRQTQISAMMPGIKNDQVAFSSKGPRLLSKALLCTALQMATTATNYLKNIAWIINIKCNYKPWRICGKFYQYKPDYITCAADCRWYSDIQCMRMEISLRAYMPDAHLIHEIEIILTSILAAQHRTLAVCTCIVFCSSYKWFNIIISSL